jgi:hypothetical protein
MNILYSCLSESWGGMEMITLTFVKELLKRNLSVLLLCTEDSRIHKEAIKTNIKTHTIKISPIYYIYNLIQISKLIKNE